MSRRSIVAISALFVGLTLLFTYPVWLSPGSALVELADVRLNTWILAWDAHALVTDPLHLFDANVFYPHARTLAFSENLIGSAVLVAPLNWAGYPVLAYNVLMLAAFALCGIGTALWVRHISGSAAAGLVAGVIWAFGPIKFDHLPHIQLLTGWWAPFAFLTLTLWIETGRRRWLWSTALLAGWQYLSGVYLGLFLLPCLGVYGLVLWLWSGSPELSRRLVTDLAVAAVILVLLVVPISLPYLEVSEAENFERSIEDQLRYSAQPVGYLSPGERPRAPYMEWLDERFRTLEANYFIGIVPALLLLLALLTVVPVAWRGAGGAASVEPASVERVSGRRASRGRASRGRASGSRSPGPRPLARRWLMRGAGALAVGAAILHAGGVVAASRASAAENPAAWIILSQRLHPALWLTAAVLVLLVGRAWSAGLGGAPSGAGTPPAAGTLAPAATGTPPPTSTGTPPPAAHVVALGGLLVLTYLLAYGPVVRAWDIPLGLGPYHSLYEYLPPYRGLRVPARMGFFWVLAVAALAGFAVRWLQEPLAGGAGAACPDAGVSPPGPGSAGSPPASGSADSPPDAMSGSTRVGLGVTPGWRRWALPAALIVLVVAEYRGWPLPTYPADPGAREVDVWLARQLRRGDGPAGDSRGSGVAGAGRELADPEGAVLHVPPRPGGKEEPWSDTEYMLGSTLHWRPLVNGYSGFIPADYDALVHQELFSDAFWRALRAEFPVEYLVVHGDELDPGFERDIAPRLLADERNARFVARVGGALVFRPRRDWQEGIRVRRRYTQERLAAIERIVLEARIVPPGSGGEGLEHGREQGAGQLLEAGSAEAPVEQAPDFRLAGRWADRPIGPWPLSGEWREIDIPPPEAWRAAADGTASLDLMPHWPHRLGDRVAWIGARVDLEVNGGGVTVYFNGEYADGSRSRGFYAILLDESGADIVERQRFAPSAAGAAAFGAYVGSLDEGRLVASAVLLDEPMRLPVPVIEGLAALGAALESPQEPIRRLAHVGLRGAPAGGARPLVHDAAVTVTIGGAGLPPWLELRSIREVSR